MPKRNSKPVDKTAKDKALFDLHPWTCQHHPDHSEIEAYVMGKGDWEIVAEVRASAYFTSEQVANYIVKAVNDYERNRELISEMVPLLEACLEKKKIDYSTEHDVEVVLRKIKQG